MQLGSWHGLAQARSRGKDRSEAGMATSDARQPISSRMFDSHFAIKQSIMPCTSSILFWMLKLIKLVSTRTRYGGPRSVLCDKNSDEDTCALRVSCCTASASSHLALLLGGLLLRCLLGCLLDVLLPDVSYAPTARSSQARVARLEHALDRRELACCLRLSLAVSWCQSTRSSPLWLMMSSECGCVR